MLGTLLVESRRDWRAILLALGGVLASVAFLKGLDHWLSVHDAMPAAYNNQSDGLLRELESPTQLFLRRRAISARSRGVSRLVPVSVVIWRLPVVLRGYTRGARGKTVLIAAAALAAMWFGLMWYRIT